MITRLTSRWTLLAVGLVLGSGCNLLGNYEPNDATTDTVAPDTVAADSGSPDTDSPDTAPPDTGSADTFGTDLDGSTDSEIDAGGDADMDTTDGGGDTTDTDSIVDFRILSPRSDATINYRVEVVREPHKVRDGSRFSAEEDNDSISTREYTWLIDGNVGTHPTAEKTQGDSYWWERVESPEYSIRCWSTPAPESEYTIKIDGVVVGPSRLPEPTQNCRSP